VNPILTWWSLQASLQHSYTAPGTCCLSFERTKACTLGCTQRVDTTHTQKVTHAVSDLQVITLSGQMASRESLPTANSAGAQAPVTKPVEGDNLLPSTLGIDGVESFQDSSSWQSALDLVVKSCVVLRCAVSLPWSDVLPYPCSMRRACGGMTFGKCPHGISHACVLDVPYANQ